MPRRTTIPIEHKQALRAYRREHPSARNTEIKAWFEAKYGRVISAPSVSEILSVKHAHLDKQSDPTQSQERPQQESGQDSAQESWPDLEEALYQWIQPVAPSPTGSAATPISAAGIREKAQFLWQTLPQHQRQPMPSFSDSWLNGFGSRRGIVIAVELPEPTSPASTAAATQLVQNLTQVQAPAEASEVEALQDPEPIPKVSTARAFKALQVLRLYMEQQEEGDIELIRTLNRHGIELQQALVRARQQRRQGEARSHLRS
ncbi:mariner-Tc1 transposon family protein [Penicillium sp. DV-2018c]|nr:mariner-Tc1 transposon family protein [Penicillium sp. DV-2018c]